MTVRVAINGFGRIGRNILRALYESGRTDVSVVAINDLASAKDNAHLLKYDSVHGIFPGKVEVDGETIIVNGHPIRVTAEKDPAKLPHGEMKVDIAFECTGIFTDADKAKLHLDAGARKVLISAPAKGEDKTVVYGVNHDQLTADHRIVSNGSCTTNCMTVAAKVLMETCGIARGYMTTIHSYTNDQRILDQVHKDMRRARAAAVSMIPTSTGAAKAVALVYPELKGKLDGTAIRVPTPNVSVVDFVFDAERDTSPEAINAAMQAAAAGPLNGILGYVTEELVSVDFNHNACSASFDATQTTVIDGKFGRVLVWYDNEWGFSNRMLDTATVMAAL
ncbi:MAG: type I glyceraldehyde-3-phosphate dehydrogenase [Sphingomonadales bacterium]|nr:MAG: type I glyceraldehyde-3-phosphate dehydrogenase [Sphingomonadales bacterium]